MAAVEFTTAVGPLGTVVDKEETEKINENTMDHTYVDNSLRKILLWKLTQSLGR